MSQSSLLQRYPFLTSAQARNEDPAALLAAIRSVVDFHHQTYHSDDACTCLPDGPCRICSLLGCRVKNMAELLDCFPSLQAQGPFASDPDGRMAALRPLFACFPLPDPPEGKDGCRLCRALDWLGYGRWWIARLERGDRIPTLADIYLRCSQLLDQAPHESAEYTQASQVCWTLSAFVRQRSRRVELFRFDEWRRYNALFNLECDPGCVGLTLQAFQEDPVAAKKRYVHDQSYYEARLEFLHLIIAQLHAVE